MPLLEKLDRHLVVISHHHGILADTPEPGHPSTAERDLIKTQVDKVWNAFWTGGISNPLEVIEQITYLLFLKRLDENQTRAENKANRTGKPVENPVFPLGVDEKGRSYHDYRWSKFKNFSRDEMYTVFAEHIFQTHFHQRGMFPGTTSVGVSDPFFSGASHAICPDVALQDH